MPSLRSFARPIFRCCNRMERYADRLTSAVGPLFVLIALVLIAISILTFFDVIFPNTFLRPTTPLPVTALGGAFCGYMVYCIVWHYAMAITTEAGRCTDPVGEVKRSAERKRKDGNGWKVPVLRHFPTPRAGVTACLPFVGGGARRETALEQARRRQVEEAQAGYQRGQAQLATVAATADRTKAALAGGQPVGTFSSGQAASGSGKGVEQLGVGVDMGADPAVEGKDRVCRKCPPDRKGRLQLKPERAHHCRVCKTCWLKFDHHCPWINSCVGLGNERYFVLFMCYLSTSCMILIYWGWSSLIDSLMFEGDWPHRTPRLFTLLTWILCAAIGVAVGVMALYQLYIVSKNETAVETHDNDWYRRKAKSRGLVYTNPYDLGRRRNLEQFFNVGEGRYPWYSILLPIPIPPASDGWEWEKSAGWTAEKNGVAWEEQLTDEEEVEDENDS